MVAALPPVTNDIPMTVSSNVHVQQDIFMSNGTFLVLMMYLAMQEYSTRVFFFEFCDVAQWQPSTRGKSQIWLQVREDSRHFLEFCYVFALRMWWTKRHLKGILQQPPKKKCCVDAKFCTNVFCCTTHSTISMKKVAPKEMYNPRFRIMGWLTSDHHYSSVDYDTMVNKVKSSDHWLGILASCQMQQVSYQLFPVQRV